MAAGTAPSLPPQHRKKGSANPQIFSPKGTRAPFGAPTSAWRGTDPAAQAGSRLLMVAASSPAPAFASPVPSLPLLHGLTASDTAADGLPRRQRGI